MPEPNKWDQFENINILPDERHMAQAMYLIQKAMMLREQPGNGWPTIHACLRDAAFHCEEARKRWTKEEMDKIDRLRGGAIWTH